MAKLLLEWALTVLVLLSNTHHWLEENGMWSWILRINWFDPMCSAQKRALPPAILVLI